MATFDPDGRGHHILHFLAGGQMSRNAVMAAMAHTLREGRKVSYVLAALQTADLIKSIPAIKGYAITEDGEDVLARLDEGSPVYVPDAPAWSGPAVPNVRIFAREASA